MDFMSRIIETKSCIPQLVSKTNQANVPLLFYGAGAYARTLYNAVANHGLNITAFVVDSLDNGATDFMGHELLMISDCLEKYEKCNILIAFHGSGFGRELLTALDALSNNIKVENVYICDCSHSYYHKESSLSYRFIEANEHHFHKLYLKLYY